MRGNPIVPVSALLMAAALALILPAIPAAAQDSVLGPVNPADWSRNMPVEAAIRAQARGGGENFRGTGFSEAYARKICAELPADRARFGASHRRVVRNTRTCRQARLIR